MSEFYAFAGEHYIVTILLAWIAAWCVVGVVQAIANGKQGD